MELNKTTYKNALHLYKEYYKTFQLGIDGYYEKRILNAEHYMLVDLEPVGIISIDDYQLTGLYIFDSLTKKYDEYLSYILNLNIVKKVMFSTIDLRLFKAVEKRNLTTEFQAYNFTFNKPVQTDFLMQIATRKDSEFLVTNFKDFIEQSMGCMIPKFMQKIDNSEIFIGLDSVGSIVSMGTTEQMILNPNRYCLGMIVLPQFRLKGYGVKTLKYLVRYLQEQEKDVNARCWYYNEASKKTLLRAGFQISNLLLRIEEL